MISIGFHISIAVFMGLTGFALTMVACDLVFLSSFLDRALSSAHALHARAAEHLDTRRAGARLPDGPVRPTPEAEGASR